MEYLNISGMMGEDLVGFCFIFDIYGSIREKNRRYNIKYFQLCDDYAEINHILRR
ncbi:hypothetical protein [Candidatus Profftia tarda]|uniref:hypothetical protein n=1 Tax=Candidatus Profftia tarda TaxID=1177216 RepID=UPI001C1F2E66|nr:hypothetical protein [Candidatus Profftia tarda]